MDMMDGVKQMKYWLMSLAAVAIAVIGIMLGIKRTEQKDALSSMDTWLCPANSFSLSDKQVTSLESAALLKGDAAAAGYLATYYSFFWCDPVLGDVWRYRALQLGDFEFAYDLGMSGLLNDMPQIFSEEALSNSLAVAMSDLARQYIRFNYYNCRSMQTNSSMSKVVCAADDWSLETAMTITGKVKVRREEGEIDYAAYKARNRWGKSCGTNQVQVLVFHSWPSIDVDGDGPFDLPQCAPYKPGTACQEAVSMAESNGWPWIVVAVDLEQSFVPRGWGMDITEEEKDNCARIVLGRVFSEFSLPSSTVVMPAGDINFVKRFTKSIEGEYKVQPAPEKLVVRDSAPPKPQ